MDGQSKNNTWVWVVIAIIAVAALLVAYYYYSYTPMPSDATGEAVTEEKIAADLDFLKRRFFLALGATRYADAGKKEQRKQS